MSLLIFVTVGSRYYPFDRLFKKIDELVEAGVIKEPVFAQVGLSSYEPKHYEFVKYLSPEEFDQKIEDADIVVCHGASGSIVKALKAKKIIIGVSRLRKYKEHINDHQVQCNEAFAECNYIIMADPELKNLGECFSRIYSGEIKLEPWVNKDPMSVINLVDNFIQENWYK